MNYLCCVFFRRDFEAERESEAAKGKRLRWRYEVFHSIYE